MGGGVGLRLGVRKARHPTANASPVGAHWGATAFPASIGSRPSALLRGGSIRMVGKGAARRFGQSMPTGVARSAFHANETDRPSSEMKVNMPAPSGTAGESGAVGAAGGPGGSDGAMARGADRKSTRL